MTRDIYQDVTNAIVTELKTGVRPWVKPWSQTPGLNTAGNAVTGRPYSGVNQLLLWTARQRGWAQARFLTFQQAREAGGHVRKGEHGLAELLPAQGPSRVSGHVKSDKLEEVHHA